MMRAAEQCHADTPHAGRRPCVLPHGAQAAGRNACGGGRGRVERDAGLRASMGDLERSTAELRRVYAALKAQPHAARVAGTGGLPSAAVAQQQQAPSSAWMCGTGR
eukprot:4076431-Prymnesium_polylepis.1